jgi:hypothetical protein
MARSNIDLIRGSLLSGPANIRQLIEKTGLSQPTISRSILTMGVDVVRIVSGKSIHYALCDDYRGVSRIPVYRVSGDGVLCKLGTLVPIHRDGFVMIQEDGKTLHSDSLPWWLYDMRPQGYLGWAYAARHASVLGLPHHPGEWNDTQVLRSLLIHGQDAVGNLLLGDAVRDLFLSAPDPVVIMGQQKSMHYARLAEQAGQGEAPGSSAGGEQPKFLAYAETPRGPGHVMVKFTVSEDNPISERWRDLLLAEHWALSTLNDFNVPAVATVVLDFGTQRFLEVERFDRVGPTGRCGLFSMAALDAEFAGIGSQWIQVARELAQSGHIEATAVAAVAQLQAFGTLIGNTDMHLGNLSFISEQGRPYTLAPAYDMLPMGFAPRSGGVLSNTLSEAIIHAGIPPAIWHQALDMARAYVATLRNEKRFSAAFQPCLAALESHVESAGKKIARLGE